LVEEDITKMKLICPKCSESTLSWLGVDMKIMTCLKCGCETTIAQIIEELHLINKKENN